jgi:hypothetical protein
MKKLFLVTISLVMMSFSFAEYNVVIGKGLPQESIKFVNKTPIEPEPEPEPELPPEPPKKVCKYDYPSNFWEGGRNSSYPTGTVVADRVYIYTGSNYNLMELTVGNTKYTRGDSKLITAELVRYEICSITI